MMTQAGLEDTIICPECNFQNPAEVKRCGQCRLDLDQILVHYSVFLKRGLPVPSPAVYQKRGLPAPPPAAYRGGGEETIVDQLLSDVGIIKWNCLVCGNRIDQEVPKWRRYWCSEACYLQDRRQAAQQKETLRQALYAVVGQALLLEYFLLFLLLILGPVLSWWTLVLLVVVVMDLPILPWALKLVRGSREHNKRWWWTYVFVLLLNPFLVNITLFILLPSLLTWTYALLPVFVLALPTLLAYVAWRRFLPH